MNFSLKIKQRMVRWAHRSFTGEGKKPLLLGLAVILLVGGQLLFASEGGAAGKEKKKEAPAADEIVAEMGDLQLTKAQMRQLLNAMDPEERQRLAANPELLNKLAGEEMVKHYLIRQAKQEGWDRKSDVRFLMARASEQAMLSHYMQTRSMPDSSFPSEQELRDLYDRNKAQLVKPDRYHLGQIFIALASDVASRRAQEKKIAEIRTRLEKEEFSAVAKQVSEHTESAAKGGDMGWVDQNGVMAVLRPVLSGLKPGETSQPIQTEYGWHFFKLLEREQGQTMSFEEARAGLTVNVRRFMAKNREGAFLDGVLKEAQPKVNSELLNALVKGK